MSYLLNKLMQSDCVQNCSKFDPRRDYLWGVINFLGVIVESRGTDLMFDFDLESLLVAMSNHFGDKIQRWYQHCFMFCRN